MQAKGAASIRGARHSICYLPAAAAEAFIHSARRGGLRVDPLSEREEETGDGKKGGAGIESGRWQG